MRNTRIDTEAGIQETLFNWVAYQTQKYPELELLHHIPNGGKRNAAEAAHLKRLGVKAGVPDLHLPVARGGYHSLYVEMKTAKGTTSEKQRKWIKALNDQGNLAIICRDWQEAAEALVNYLELGTLKEAGKPAGAFADQQLLQPATY